MGAPTDLALDPHSTPPQGTEEPPRECGCVNRPHRAYAPVPGRAALARVRAGVVPSAVRDQGQRGEGLGVPRPLHPRPD